MLGIKLAKWLGSSISSLLAVTLLVAFTSAQSYASQTKPNVILIVVDDLGWADVGYNDQNHLFQTPNINALAKQSVNFSNAYAGAANCAPSRAVLMSGQYGPRHGIYTVSPSERGQGKTRKLIPEPNTDILADNNVTMAEMFKMNGYTTGHFGKWHLGDDAKTQGFDHNIAGHLKGHPKTYFSPYNLPFLENGPKGEYLPDRLTTEAIKWMAANKDKKEPFFTYIPYYTVHTPLQAIQSLKQKYLKHPKIRNKKHATYAAMVEAMDTNIGRIREFLATNGLEENTLLVFTSDNGGIRAISHQDPLRAGKGSYYEGGLKVPLLVSWPKTIKPTESEERVINADLYPTFVNIINAKKMDKVLDGKDLSPVLIDEKELDERALFFHFPIYLQAYSPVEDQSRDPLFRTRPGSVIVKGNWKLHHYFEDNAYELYDLKNDVGENTNVASNNPDIVKKMVKELDEWRAQVNAPVPTELNPRYNAKFEQQQIATKLKEKPKF